MAYLLTFMFAMSAAAQPTPGATETVTTPVRFPSLGEPAVQLEGVLERRPKEGPQAGVVLCHPHPLYRGTMDHEVILSLSRELVRRGFAVLRFNFRGVGRSEGAFAHDKGETEDVRGAVKFLAAQEGMDPQRLYLGGYSYGAYIALRAAPSVAVKAFVGVGLPLDAPTRDWEGYDLAAATKIPLLLISGDQDVFSHVDSLKQLQQRMGDRLRLHLIAGANHFFTLPDDTPDHPRVDEAARVAGDFLAGLERQGKKEMRDER
jgi:alpha/beta superfamily hydrolase